MAPRRTKAGRRILDAAPFPAAEELLAHIRANYVKGGVPAFCEAHNLDRIKVQNAIKGFSRGGGLPRITVEFDFAIERATGIKAEGWCLTSKVLKKFARFLGKRSHRQSSGAEA